MAADTKVDTFNKAETKARFDAILRGAMHKPTPHKDVPQKKKRKPTKASASAGRASGKT
jgi:hypothetical protein